jgi:tetratricopeptide (TPR) repeat protein
MNRRATALVLSACLLTAATAAAQKTERPEKKTGVSPQTARMYEDIEILRRLLIKKLQIPWPKMTLGGTVQYWQPVVSYLQVPNNSALYSRQVATEKRPIDIEGVYLKGQGVVYSLTLPMAAPPLAKGGKPADKPLTEWDRTRQELRGKKPATNEGGTPAPQGPSLTNIILKVLADNGHHLKRLGENESVTVAVTFRPPYPKAFPGANFSQTASSGNNWAQKSALLNNDPNRGIPRNPSTARDYELLGDLHLRQGKASEAVNAYQNALSQKPPAQQAAAICRKLARAYLSQNNDAAARKAIALAVKFLKNAPNERQNGKVVRGKVAANLPAKLIISASKKLLDQVGRGKITFAEFRKEASVEYVNFSARTK